MTEIQEIVELDLMGQLIRMRDTSKSMLVQNQMKDAIADVRRARTLIEKARRKLAWAKQYTPNPA